MFFFCLRVLSEAVLTESEEERDPEPVVQSATTVCHSKNKEAAEQEDYSSEASNEDGECPLNCCFSALQYSIVEALI